MTHYAFIPSDKTIVKDGVGYIIPSDDTWLNDYSSIHAIQITDSSGEVEPVSGENRSATAEEIKAVKDKWTALKAVDDKANDDYNNSWDRVRTDRSFWLADTDWTVMPDSALTSEKQQEYKTYRSNLRNIPQTYSSSNPKDITFDDGNVSVSGTQKITKPS
ncbi:MAG: phage tail assembly chaperone [Bacteroidota bacterium]|nr:phage tail assembly chaperone [Bacteroidota bacterium]